MKKITICFITTLFSVYCVAQNNNINCDVLSRLIGDERLLNLFDIDLLSMDTITIIDSTMSFKTCSSLNSGNKTVIVTTDLTILNLDPKFRKDIHEWKNHIVLYQLEITKRYRTIHYYHKPTNANGFVRYKIKGGRIIAVDYTLGWL